MRAASWGSLKTCAAAIRPSRSVQSHAFGASIRLDPRRARTRPKTSTWPRSSSLNRCGISSISSHIERTSSR